MGTGTVVMYEGAKGWTRAAGRVYLHNTRFEAKDRMSLGKKF